MSWRPWRAVAYLAARLPLPALGALVMVAPFSRGWSGLPIALALGLVYVIASVAAAPVLRRLVTLLDRAAVPAPRRARLRAATYALLSALLAPLDAILLIGWSLGSLALLASPLLIGSGDVAAGPWTIDSAREAWTAVPVGVVLLVAGAYAVIGAAGAHAWLVRELLGPRGEELREQVTELTRSRLRLIDAFDVERRRIERDLHDGAQQQLVALAMTLDLARIELEGTEHAEAARLVDHAHTQATSTMTRLRDLIHAIHPPVLADRGLPGAVEELADRSALRVDYTAALPRRLPESIETAAYFVLAEALTNAGKHSGTAPASRCRARDTLVLSVRDDGVGGASADSGSGLAGLGDRIAAVDGRLTLSSPRGGPTMVRAEIPCP